MKLLQELDQMQLPLVEDVADGDYKQLIARAYRAQRSIIAEAFQDYNPGRATANAAARQARKLLYMAPQVSRADMPGVKALAIKTWNQTYKNMFKNMGITESKVKEEVEARIKSILQGDYVQASHDDTTDILDQGKQFNHRSFRTAMGLVRVLAYSYKGETYAAVERPGEKTQVFKKRG